MRPKTEELLYYLLWSCEMLTRPTFRNLTTSFEGWAYSNGLHRHLAELQRQQFLQDRSTGTARSSRSGRVVRLTEQGRLHALGGRDPQRQWQRKWDQRWRLVLFDLPIKQNALRNRLRKELRRRGFGCLQRSVWITPDPLDEQTRALLRTEIDVRSLTIFEGHPAAGESDEQIARAAWDFVGINRAYEKQRKLLEEAPLSRSPTERDARTLRTWARAERAGWLAAVTVDPMLPQPLLPPGYLGKETWELRIKVLGKAAEQLRSFTLEKTAPSNAL